MLNSNDDSHGDQDSPDGKQAACKTSDVETGMTKQKQSFRRNSKKISQESGYTEVDVLDSNPREQLGLIRRLSKRFSLSSPSASDKNKTVSVPVGNTVNSLKEQEGECNATESQDAKGTVENTKLPLSAMEINLLISKNSLLEANENINKLEEELLNEAEPEKGEVAHQEYTKKVRDFNLLCDELVKQIMSIITNSFSITKSNSSILYMAVQVVELEEAADKKWQERMDHPGVKCFRRPRKWQDLWRETVRKSVEERIAKVVLPTKAQQKSWLALHLVNLQKTILEDLKIVKDLVQSCYPEKYNIFNVYIKYYHETVSSHLECIQQKHLEMNELYSFLNWIIHTYKSGDIMSHPDLSPEVNVEELSPLLDQKVIENVMDKYAKELKMIHEYLNKSGDISNKLKDKALHICLDELTNLLHCYQRDLKVKKRSIPNPLPLLIVSVNSYIDLREYVVTLKQGNAVSVGKVEETLNNVVRGLNEILVEDILKLCFKKIVARKWLLGNDDFNLLINNAETYCEELKKMKQANYQVLISDIHFQFVKEYITQIMKQQIYCKSSRQRDAAAIKVREELGAINKMYEERGSTASWLFLVTQDLSDFIGSNKNELETKLNTLYMDYPDISKEHVSALLYFRGIARGKQKSNLMKYFNQLEKDSEGSVTEARHVLFDQIVVTGPVKCMPSFT
ncbi:exocyst complex component 3-like isoform X2 [Scyliorhinus canicula]|uniref:exocyst complex component 3-like isoform X2 n=1 Tax=Scyliorhinus canicula TaxID=7830 RepID=UPI0018F6E248|nr:exocyst complex component 3-like isoform X2 [Scyliorhinus canicula]